VTRARLLLAGAVVLALLGLGLALGRGAFGAHEGAGVIKGAALPREAVEARAEAQRAAAQALVAHEDSAAPEAAPSQVPKSILFGDLHVHTSVSLDAFLMSLPLAGGEGAHPAADACDFARYCSALDFWSLNDHAESLTPERWGESVASIRQCNAVAGDPNNPDVVSYLGWEWTQVGETAAEHWGHRNVILRDLADDAIPARPIAARRARVSALGAQFSLPMRAALVAANVTDPRVHGFARYVAELEDAERCAPDVPTRELRDCMESAATPGELFAKLRSSRSAALVIPHGTAWGFTASPLASWDTQLGADANDPALQRLIEVYSGHGSSEEYRAWRPLLRGEDDAIVCPAPTPDYTPQCWRAGEIIERRCLAQGEKPDDCAERAAEARALAANARGRSADDAVPLASGDDWGDAGQCRDCFLPAYALRPLMSVQYALALTSFANPVEPWRYRFGFIAASDVHSARPGTGYKEFARRQMVDGQRDGAARREWDPPSVLPARAVAPDASRTPGFMRLAAGPVDDRIGASLFTGGLVAVHAAARNRGAIWDALARREVYGTSGPRTMLWFDLLNAPDEIVRPMGGEVRMRFAPRFRVRAIGSQKQAPGCPELGAGGLAPERVARLCRGECWNPSDERHLITRIEVVRIRPQREPNEPVDELIDDPWKSFACPPDSAGCAVEFADDDFAVAARDSVYYVRAIEEPTPAVNGKGLDCQPGAAGACTTLDATPASPDDDRLGPVEERAWSSPIFVDYAAQGEAAAGARDASDAAGPPPEPSFDPARSGERDPSWSQVEGEF
jgi:hypothetical protein